MQHVMVTVAPELDRARILVVENRREVLKAVLGPPSEVHPRAATLLSGPSLGYQTHLSVAPCADAGASSSSLHLSDRLDLGHTSIYFDVDVAYTEPRAPPSSADSAASRTCVSFRERLLQSIL